MNIDFKDFVYNMPDEASAKELSISTVQKFFNINYASLVVNGTVAIEIILKALCLPIGSLVIIPDLSFIATATAVANCGLIPIYADINDNDFGINIESITAKYRKEVKAVIVVHFSGFVNRDILLIREFCDSKNIYLIEDCAQSLPCKINNKRVGTIGHAASFSFQSSKIISTGEGGLIITNSPQIQQNCESVINWNNQSIKTSMEKDPLLPVSNFRLSSILSFILVKQFERIDELILKHNQRIEELLENCKKVRITAHFAAPESHIYDFPFFFIIKTIKRLNTVEPRTEYPMRKSTFVKNIYKRLFPDLLATYLKLNEDGNEDRIVDYVLREYDFINIKQTSSINIRKIILPYYEFKISDI